MASLTVQGVRKKLGDNAILQGIDLGVTDGEFAVLVGPSGCGKSTLLRTIAGLEEPDSGEILLGGRDVTRAPPRDRDVAMVFQSYALYPHLTVRDNLAFGLRLRKTDPSEVSRRVSEVSEMLGLGALLDRLPRALSGGQRQRVAMGRAIARRPQLFLFDEPLSNLDAALRTQVRIEIKRMHSELGATMVYVTHDQVEAMTLADRLVVLNAGRVEQQGPPLEVFHRPVSRFVAGFLGSPAMNFIEGEVRDGVFHSEGVRLEIESGRFDETLSGRVVAGVRPHELVLSESGSAVELIVDVVETMGSESFAHGTVVKKPFIARLDGDSLRRPGDRLNFSVDPSRVHLFDVATGRSLAVDSR